MGNSNDSLNRLFEVLTDHRRRYVLYYLDETDNEVVSLDELTEQLCYWEREWDDQMDKPRSKHEEDIRIDLHHAHLPQMADSGVIEYDARSETVRNRIDDSLLEAVQHKPNECPRLEALFPNVKV